MEFADWVKKTYGLGDDVQSALEMNLQLCAKSISALNKVTPRFDEEPLTGAMIGAFVGSYPLCAASYPGPAEDALQWRSYGKNDPSSFGETATGADFALMLLIPNRPPRLAIFQAKSDASKSKVNNRLYVGQIKKSKKYPKDAKGKVVEGTGSFYVVYRNQVKTLTDTALAIHRHVNPSAKLKDLSWVHYLGQFVSGVVAVPISKITGFVETSIAEVSVESVDLNAHNSLPFEDLLIDACKPVPDYWLEIGVDLDGVMPTPVDLTKLANMMPVVVGGGAGAMAMTFTMSGIEPTALGSVIVSSSPTTPAATAAPMAPKPK